MDVVHYIALSNDTYCTTYQGTVLIKILLQVVVVLLGTLNCDFEKVKLRFALLLCASPNLLITCMITGQVGLPSVLLPLLIGKGVKTGLFNIPSWHIKVLWSCRSAHYILCVVQPKLWWPL